MKFAIALAFAAAVAVGFKSLASDHDRASQMLDAADARFRTALAERDAASAMATESFLDAARTYEAIASMGFRNANLYVDAGNAYLLGGDIGRAVLSFRRADDIRPYDQAVKAGLADARERVQVAVALSPGSRSVQFVTAWRRLIPAPTMIAAFAVLYASAWLVAMVNAARPGLIPRAIGVGLGVSAGLVVGLVVIDHRVHDGTRAGVVIAEGITARNGPSASVYDPTFTTPLRPGVELMILESRDGWHRVRLADARETWLPAYAIERVESRRGDNEGSLR